MREAWTALHPLLTQSTPGFRLRLDRLDVAPVEQALWCPTTRRVLDVGFRGLSPYDRGRIHPRATPILMPRLAFPNGRAASGRRVDDVEIERHLADRTSVAEGKSVSVRVDPGCRSIIKKQFVHLSEDQQLHLTLSKQ